MKNINKILTTLNLSASDTREDTIKSIIKTTLNETKHPITLLELKDNIDIVYDVTLYDIESNTIIDDLINKGEVVCEKELYSLSEEERNILIELGAKLKSDEVLRYQNFKNFVENNSNNIIEEFKIKELWKALKNFLYCCFFQYGIKAIEFLHPQYVKNADENIQNGEVLNDAIKNLNYQELVPIFKIVIDKFPDYATKEDLDFINEIGQKALAFASLGLSPEQAKEDLNTELINWTLFLDTNFLFSILDLHVNVENDACKELLKLVVLNKDIINIKFRYSELTLKELRHKKSDFLNLDDSLTNSAINAILKSEELDDFARKFYSDLLKNRDETLHPSKIIDFAEITLPKKGIEIYRSQKLTDSLNEEYIDARIKEYNIYISDINKYRDEFSEQNNTFLRPYFRSDSQLKHDVTLRELILHSRNQFKRTDIKTFNEIKYYGITLDELLIKFDNNKIRSDATEPYPTFFKPSFLLNKLVKLLPIKTPDYKKAFIKAVSSKGFHRETQTSNDIIKIASYLRKHGIDNEEVILNLISEKLFLEKFHRESSNPDFNSEYFFESELNKIIETKEKELAETKNKVAELLDVTKQEKDEKFILIRQNEIKEKDIKQFTLAIEQLNKKIIKLEEQTYVKVIEPTINFEAAEIQTELDSLKKDLLKERKKNIEFENEKRKLKREKYIYNKILWWRFRSFIWIIVLPLTFLLLYLSLKNSQLFPNEPIEKSLDYFISTQLVKGMLFFITLIYQAIFISIFTSKFFQTNKSKFIEHINLPENVIDIYE